MSRPLRVEIEDGWYHVISPGIERREIFRDDSDRRDFLERIFGLTQSHAVVVHGYCLMGNHFHLQLQTVRPNLKEAMQKLLSGYVVRFNLRHRRAGPLFQGRYRAILIGEGEWISEVNRYVHLNPVRVESVELGKQRGPKSGGESGSPWRNPSLAVAWRRCGPFPGVPIARMPATSRGPCN